MLRKRDTCFPAGGDFRRLCDHHSANRTHTGPSYSRGHLTDFLRWHVFDTVDIHFSHGFFVILGHLRRLIGGSYRLLRLLLLDDSL